MPEFTPAQVADLLRKCSTNPVCEEGRPLHAEHPKCVRTLMQGAAVIIDGQADVIETQAAKIEALRKLADEYFK